MRLDIWETNKKVELQSIMNVKYWLFMTPSLAMIEILETICKRDHKTVEQTVAWNPTHHVLENQLSHTTQNGWVFAPLPCKLSLPIFFGKIYRICNEWGNILCALNQTLNNTNLP
jgi:hypothetical protein